MAKHDMGPSNVEGFHQQCRNCGALDTEIRFALGDECPNAPAYEIPAEPRVTVLEPTNRHQAIALMQANWFNGFFGRQLAKAFKL